MTLWQSREELVKLQKWMLSVITHPDGVLAGVASAEARQQIDAPPDELEQIIERSHNLTSVERLQVYGNAYYARLIECLQEEFPATAHALGEETFGAFAFEYLQAYPPRSYTLAKLAADFPRFLRDTRPAQDTDDGGGGDWADFLIDLATLERTYSEVFDRPGPERQGTLRPDEVAALSADQWPNARLVPVDCLRLIQLRFPVHEFASAVRHGQKPTIPSPAETYLVVSRRNYVVHPRAVSKLEFEALMGLSNGRSVGEVISLAAGSCDLDFEQLSIQIRGWFQRWSADGLFIGIGASD
ncbi:MAG: DNA-binding domain-containing protein [Planctomycetes bacterium]|nr:DNA-binding domain-containing protein [Planctomycetota bacterium]